MRRALCLSSRLATTLAALLVALGAALALSAPAGAATHTWKPGSHPDPRWSVGDNWDGGVPTSGEFGGTVVQFNGASTPVLDIDVTVDRLIINGDANVLDGDGTHQLTLSSAELPDNLVHSGTNNTLTSSFRLGLAPGSTGVTVHSTSGLLEIAAPISGPSNSSVEFSSSDPIGATPTSGTRLTADNTFAGTISVVRGLLLLDSPNADQAFRGAELQVSGTGQALIEQPHQLADTTAVSLSGSGVLDAKSNAETVGSLSIDGQDADLRLGAAQFNVQGQVTVRDALVNLGTGRLTVGGALNMTGGEISGSATPSLSLGGNVTLTRSTPSSPRRTPTFSARTALNGARTFAVADDSTADADAELKAPVENGTGTGSLTIAGAGTIDFSAGNTFTGALTVASGRVRATGVASGGPIRVGDGIGSAATASFEMLENRIAADVPITVESDGRLLVGTRADSILSSVQALSVNGGQVVTQDAGSQLTVDGTLSLSAAELSGPGKLIVSAIDVLAAGSPSKIATRMVVDGLVDTPITVGDGAAANDLEISGKIVPSDSWDYAGDGPLPIRKLGPGTVVDTAGITNTVGTALLLGVEAGTWEQHGPLPVAITVGTGGRLTGDATQISTLTVNGRVEPTGNGFSVRDLVFGPVSRFQTRVTADAAPGISATSTITIDPAAQLELLSRTGATPAGTPGTVIVNTASDPAATTGSFATASVTAGGLSFVVSRPAADNDVLLRANAAPPVVGITPIEASLQAQVGKAVDLTANATDANEDPLTYAWDFGDGAKASGTSTVSHAYDAPGTFTVTVSVSDGGLVATADRIVVVTTKPVATPTPTPGPGVVAGDKLAPVLSVGATAKQKLSSKSTIALRVKASEPATVTIASTFKVPGVKKPLKATKTVKLTAAGAVTTVYIAVPSKLRKPIKRALKAKRKPTIAVAITAVDAAGNRSKAVAKTVTLKR